MHWADNGTAAALRTLPRRLAGLPIAWFLASRPGQGSAQLRAALADISSRGADRLQLGSLSDEAVAQVVRDILDAEPGDTALGRYHDEVWGTRTYDESAMFEALTRGVFQVGLSWSIAFGKRDAFRKAFRELDAGKVAAMTGGILTSWAITPRSSATVPRSRRLSTMPAQ